jgi:hypothetical protein
VINIGFSSSNEACDADIVLPRTEHCGKVAVVC